MDLKDVQKTVEEEKRSSMSKVQQISELQCMFLCWDLSWSHSSVLSHRFP